MVGGAAGCHLRAGLRACVGPIWVGTLVSSPHALMSEESVGEEGEGCSRSTTSKLKSFDDHRIAGKTRTADG